MARIIKKCLLILFVVVNVVISITLLANSDTDKTIYLANSNTHTLQSLTKKDDLSINPNKGSLTDNDELIANSENGLYTLYVNRDLCIFKVKNNITNMIYTSALDEIPDTACTKDFANYMSSSFIVKYYKYNEKTGDNVLTINSSYLTTADRLSKSEKEELGERDEYYFTLSSNEDVTTTYSNINNGVKVDFVYHDINISFSSEVFIDNEGLHVSIENESIKEDKNLISSIITMPAMGATYNNETPGYMVIPDGAGALIRYGEITPKNAIFQNITFFGSNRGALNYGVDGVVTVDSISDYNAYNLTANVFGLINGIKQDGVYGIIEEGQYHCDLLISICGAKNVYYNYLALEFIKRYDYKEYGVNEKILKTKNDESISINYRFLSNEEATYVGMANKYREYLIDKNILKEKEITYKTRVDYLLSETSKGIIGNKKVIMTKVEKILEISKTLKESGLNQVSVLKGWNKSGLSGSTPYKIKYNSSVGSKKEFQKLEDNISEVYYYNDYIVGYDSGNISTRSDVARATQNLRMNFLDEETSLYQKFYYLNPSSSEKISNNDIKKYNKLGIDNLALDSYGSILFTYLDKSSEKLYLNRSDSIKFYLNSLNNFLNGNKKIALFNSDSYLYAYADSLFNVPIYANSYTFYTDNIPFTSYVLKGCTNLYSNYVNFFANSKVQLLRMLDYGIMPSYIITDNASYNLKYTNSYNYFTTNYVDFKDAIINNDSIYKNGYINTVGATVIDREIIADGIILNTYDNNISLLLNYTNKEYFYLDQKVDSYSYLIIGDVNGK